MSISDEDTVSWAKGDKQVKKMSRESIGIILRALDFIKFGIYINSA